MESRDVVVTVALALILYYSLVSSLLALGNWVLDSLLGPVDLDESE